MNNQPGHNAMIHGQIPSSRQWIVFFSSLLIVVVAIWCTPRLDWTMGPQIWSQFADWSRTYLPFPNEQNPGNWTLGPALFTLVFATALRLLFDRPPDCLRLPVGFGFLSLQVAYLWFRLVATLSLDTP